MNVLPCNDVSHWLDASLKSALHYMFEISRKVVNRPMPLLSVASFFTAIALWPKVNEDKGWISLYQEVFASATCNLHRYELNQLCVCSLQWRHNEHDVVSIHHRLHCLLNRLFRRRSKKTPKLRVTGLCEGNPPVTGGFPSQSASNAENVSIWWRHRVLARLRLLHPKYIKILSTNFSMR